MSFGRRGVHAAPAPPAQQRSTPRAGAKGAMRVLPWAGAAALLLMAATTCMMAVHQSPWLQARPASSAPRDAETPADPSKDAAAPDPEAVLRSFPNVQVLDYAVEGQDAAAIRASIRAAGLHDAHDQQPVDATTDWRIDWRWPGDSRGGCDLAGVTTTFRATVSFPALVEPDRLSPDLARAWARYRTALARHEAAAFVEAMQGPQ